VLTKPTTAGSPAGVAQCGGANAPEPTTAVVCLFSDKSIFFSVLNIRFFYFSQQVLLCLKKVLVKIGQAQVAT
jgi:hypothetical protein